ncbi:hypothetical protein [Methanobrevibacter sp.]|uniref:hypothetical protein n=1 Tax=Methanobrevibacter sp. TaxID=66852 RepID=UPI003869949A
MDLLGNNSHTVIKKYSVKTDKTFEIFSENEIQNNKLELMKLKDKYNLISLNKNFQKTRFLIKN